MIKKIVALTCFPVSSFLYDYISPHSIFFLLYLLVLVVCDQHTPLRCSFPIPCKCLSVKHYYGKSYNIIVLFNALSFPPSPTSASIPLTFLPLSFFLHFLLLLVLYSLPVFFFLHLSLLPSSFLCFFILLP